jgi:hypothetical protein
MELELRQRVVDALTPQHRPALDAFGRAITTRAGNRLACWGDIERVISGTIQTDEDAMALWNALIEVGEPRALAVVFAALRRRSAFRRAVVRDFARLPPFIQTGLATQDDVRPLLVATADRLAPAAREVLAKSYAALVDDRAVYEAFVASLEAQRAATFDRITDDLHPPEASEAQPSGDHP